MLAAKPITFVRGILPRGANSSGSLLRLALFALAVLLFVFSAVQEVRAQSASVIPINVNRAISIAARSAATTGLQVAESGSVIMGQVGSALGSVAINEIRTVSLGAIAGRVVASSVPAIVALLAIDLINYGIKQCTTATSGWCGPAQSPNAGDTGFNAHQWRASIGGYSGAGDSPDSSCKAAIAAYNAAYGLTGTSGNTASVGVFVSATQYGCAVKKPDGTAQSFNGVTYSQAGCDQYYVLSGSSCIPDPNAPKTSYTYPQLSSQLGQVLSSNPNRSKDYWGFMPWTDQLAALSDPATSASPAEIVTPANGQVVGPRTTTTTAAGTTTQQTTYTISPNTDVNTLATNPVIVTATTTTTNPDGTTSTTTTTSMPTQTTPNGQPASSPAASNPLPASSVTPCGLGSSGSPKCQIDETGTKQQADVDSAQSNQTSALSAVESGLESAANAQLGQVDAQHTANTAHFLTVLNMIPSFGTETCTPPTINDTFNKITITPAICDWYYAAKDIISLIISFGFMLGAVFMVRDAARVGASG